MKAGITVGVSIFNTDGANIWSSGINQNIAFLVQMLLQMPGVARVVLLNGGDSDQLSPMLAFDVLGVPLVRPSEVTYDIDVVIEMGAKLPVEWMRRVEARGAKIIWFLVGHSYISVTEVPMFGIEAATPFNGSPVHEVWYLPQHKRTCAPMLQTVTRAPAFEMPHIWSPTFINREIELHEPATGVKFGFKPHTNAWNLAIMEPNISVVKCCFIPMLVCDQAYRLEPQFVGTMRVMNSFHMKEHMTFNRFASHLDLTRDGRASYEPRMGFVEAMLTQKIDAVVAHQWECELNYAYYDALYGGYPLVHNSAALREAGVGIYYEGFAASEGAKVLLAAWHKPKSFWTKYSSKSRAFLDALSPDSQKNTIQFAERIFAKPTEARP